MKKIIALTLIIVLGMGKCFAHSGDTISQWEWSGNGTSWQNSTPSGWIYVTTSSNEYKISLSKLGISPDTNKTLGVLFSFMDWSTSNDEITWPSGGHSNLTNPDSWANMIILNNSIGINENKASKNESTAKNTSYP